MKISLLLLVLILTGCRHKTKEVMPETVGKAYQTENEAQSQFRKIRDFVLKVPELEIGRIEPPILVSNDKKKLVYYDSGFNQILVSDTLGNILSKFGRKGSGPKEFRHITSYGLNQDTIYVYDGGLSVFKKFTINGDLIKIFDGPIKDNLWFRSNRIYIKKDKMLFGIQEVKHSSASSHWLSRTVAEYSTEGKLISLFGEYDPSLKESSLLYKYANMAYDFRTEHIYTVHRTSPYIQKFDFNSKKKISRFSNKESGNFLISDTEPGINSSREERNALNLLQSFVGDPFISEDFFVFYFFNFTQEYWDTRDQSKKEHFLQFYDKQDNFVSEFRVLHFPLGMIGNNKLLLVEDDDPDNFRIGVYAVQ